MLINDLRIQQHQCNNTLSSIVVGIKHPVVRCPCLRTSLQQQQLLLLLLLQLLLLIITIMLIMIILLIMLSRLITVMIILRCRQVRSHSIRCPNLVLNPCETFSLCRLVLDAASVATLHSSSLRIFPLMRGL